MSCFSCRPLAVILLLNAAIFSGGCASKKAPKPADSGIVDCFDLITSRITEIDGCPSATYVYHNWSQDNLIIYCDLDGDFRTRPEIAFHSMLLGSDLEELAPPAFMSEEPICVDSFSEVREVSFLD